MFYLRLEPFPQVFPTKRAELDRKTTFRKCRAFLSILDEDEQSSMGSTVIDVHQSHTGFSFEEVRLEIGTTPFHVQTVF